jgi:hypothetical protein
MPLSLLLSVGRPQRARRDRCTLATSLPTYSDRCSFSAGHVYPAWLTSAAVCDRPLPDRLSSHTCSFSAAHFLGHCFGLIPASAVPYPGCTQRTSRLLLSRFRPNNVGFPPIKQPLSLEAEALASGCPRKNGASYTRRKNGARVRWEQQESRTILASGQGRRWFATTSFSVKAIDSRLNYPNTDGIKPHQKEWSRIVIERNWFSSFCQS